MEKHIIKAAELILSYKKFKKYVGNNFAYEPSEIIEVLKETLKEKELSEQYEECAEILKVINKLK
jgi:hypothetical protein